MLVPTLSSQIWFLGKKQEPTDISEERQGWIRDAECEWDQAGYPKLSGHFYRFPAPSPKLENQNFLHCAQVSVLFESSLN